MGNHSIDCEFCGRDQRSHGVYFGDRLSFACCKEYQAQHDRKREEKEEALAAARELLKRWGMPVYRYTETLSIIDVAEALRGRPMP